jgi:hypothetical protein
MINSPEEIRDFCRMTESYQREGRRREVRESWDSLANMWRTGEINHDRFSLRRTFEESVRDGHNVVRQFKDSGQYGGSGVFYEAGNGVNTTHFANIIGQITFAEVLMTMEQPSFIAMDLVTTRPASTQEQEILPGVTMLGDAALNVGEGGEYPEAGIGEDYTIMPKKIKEGFIVSVTEEAVFEDKTNLILERARGGSKSIAISQEKDGLDMCLGITTSWKRKANAATATYADNTAGTHPFDNLNSNTLTNHDSIATAENSLFGMTDLNTGEPITFPQEMQIVYPHQLRTTVHWILNSDQIQRRTSSATLIAFSPNPVGKTGPSYTPKSNQYVNARSGSATTWWIGAFKEAFEYAEIWPTQLFVEDRNSAKGFSSDVIFRSKVRRKGAFGVRNPQFVIKNT